MTAADDLALAERLRAAVQHDPRNPVTHRRLGQVLRRLGLDEQAGEAEMAAIRATAYDPARATCPSPSRACARAFPSSRSMSPRSA